MSKVTGADTVVRIEKQLKHWHRDWKVNLINESNPNWDDLSESVLGILSNNANSNEMLN